MANSDPFGFLDSIDSSTSATPPLPSASRLPFASQPRKNKNLSRGVLISICLFCVFLGLMVGIGVSRRPSDPPTAKSFPVRLDVSGLSLEVDSNRSLVREYLRENLPDGKFEEIKWSPSLEFQSYFLWNNMFELQHPGISRIHGNEFNHGQYCWMRNDRSGTSLELKFRFKNGLGGNSVGDWTFVILDGKVVAHADPIDFRASSETVEEWSKRTGYGDSALGLQKTTENKLRQSFVDGLHQVTEEREVTESIKVPQPLGDDHRMPKR